MHNQAVILAQPTKPSFWRSQNLSICLSDWRYYTGISGVAATSRCV
jgi:hypothetical protein